ADFVTAHELDPNDPTHPVAWYNVAMLELQRGDRAGYRKVCSKMLEHLERPANAEVAYWITWTCVLIPDAVGDWKKPLELAQKASANHRRRYEPINNLGAVLYRAGRFDEAAQRLSEAETAFYKNTTKRSTIVYNWFFQAMAQHRLGHAAEAASWLKKAVQE